MASDCRLFFWPDAMCTRDICVRNFRSSNDCVEIEKGKKTTLLVTSFSKRCETRVDRILKWDTKRLHQKVERRTLIQSRDANQFPNPLIFFLFIVIIFSLILLLILCSQHIRFASLIFGLCLLESDFHGFLNHFDAVVMVNSVFMFAHRISAGEKTEKEAHSSEISVRIETKMATNQLSTTHPNGIRDENLLQKLCAKKTVIRSLKLFNYFAQELIIYIQNTHIICVGGRGQKPFTVIRINAFDSAWYAHCSMIEWRISFV